MIKNHHHSQFLLEIILKKVQVKQKFPISIKLTLAIHNENTTILSQHSSNIRNNTVSFHNQTIQMDLSQNIQIAVIAIKPKQQELGRIKIQIQDFQIEDLTNRKFVTKLPDRQIFIHYEINIINRHILQSQTQNQQISQMEIQTVNRRDPTLSRISQTLNQTQRLEVQSPEYKAKSQINLNNGIIHYRLQQSQELFRLNDKMVELTNKLSELREKNKKVTNKTKEQTQNQLKIANNNKLILKYKNENRLLAQKGQKKSIVNILLVFAFIIGFAVRIFI